MTVVPQPYPDARAWEDISAYLSQGVSEREPFNCLAAVDGNFVHYSLRCVIDVNDPNIDTRWIVRGLPVRFRPGVATTATAWFAVGIRAYPYRVSLSTDGSFNIPDWAVEGILLKDFTSFSLTGIAVRRA